MPLSPSANYNTAAVLRNKQPVWIIEIENVDDKFTDGTFTDITSAYKKLISEDSDGIDFSFQGLDFTTNRVSPASGRFTLIDKDLAITGLIKDNNLVGKKVTIKHGYSTLAIADFLTVYDYLYIDNIQFGYGFYTFYVSDPTFGLGMDLFRSIPSTRLPDGLLAAETTSVNADSTEGFRSPTTPVFDSQVFFIVDQEIIAYAGMSATTFTTLTRGQFGTTPADHDTDSIARQLYVFRLPRYQQLGEIILSLLMTTDAGSNGEFDGGYVGVGAGIPKAKINIDEIREVTAGIYTQFASLSYYYKNVLTTNLAEQAVFFLRRESAASVFQRLLAPINCVFAIGGDGRLTVKRADYFSFIAAQNNLTAQETWIGRGRPTLDIRGIINSIKFKTDVLPFTVSPTLNTEDSFIVKYDTSITEFGEYPDKEITWPNNDFFDSDFAANAEDDLYPVYLFAEYFWLFGDNNVYVDFDSFVENMKYTGGDVVGINDSNFPNIGTASRGLTNKPYLITSKATNRTGLSFSGIFFKLINRLTTPTALDDYAVPDDQALAEDADDSDTIQAADAYIANPSGTNNLWKFKIELVQPGSASAASREYVDLSLWLIPNTGDLTADGTKKLDTVRLYYDRNSSATLVYEIYVWTPLAVALQRAKVDWTATSTAVGGDKPTTLSFTGFIGKNVTTNVTCTRQRIPTDD